MTMPHEHADSHPDVPRVAFQGERGAYSEDAIRAFWPGGADPVPARSSDAVAQAVASGTAALGMLAVENTLAGAVGDSYDALAAVPELVIVGEVVIPIHHALLALPGATLETLRSVESHPVALAQCRRLFAAHPAALARAVEDTAGAAADVAAGGDLRRAAIASASVAERLGLQVLAARVEDRPDNQTRFVVVAHASAMARAASVAPPVAGAPACTSMLIEPAGGAAGIVPAVETIAHAGLELRGLVTRPTGEPWRPRLFLDVAHPADDPRLTPMLGALSGRVQRMRVLGTFARAAAAGREPLDRRSPHGDAPDTHRRRGTLEHA